MAGNITGRVVDAAGAPLAGAAVYIDQSDQPHHDIAAITAADGSFRLSGLRPGKYRLGIHAEGLGGLGSVQLIDARTSSAEISLG